MEYEVVLIDATKTPIERSKKGKRIRNALRGVTINKNNFIRGKKRRHTLKRQVVLDQKTKQVICTAFANGKRHDFRLFKESKTKINPDIKIIAEIEYQGIQKLHAKFELPKQKTKKNPLTQEERQKNQELSSERGVDKNVIGMMKRFKIISDKYRNRRKRFGLRFNLIACIYKMELAK